MFKVKDLPYDDRPREKLIDRGAQNLSEAELLAILLRTGVKGKSVIELAQLLLSKNKLALLASKSPEFFTKTQGIWISSSQSGPDGLFANRLNRD